MSQAHPWYRWQGDDLIVSIHIQPRASRDGIASPLGEYLRVRVTAPPVEGKANRHLCDYLAKVCGVAKHRVALIAGQRSRYKRIRISKPARLPPHIER